VIISAPKDDIAGEQGIACLICICPVRDHNRADPKTKTRQFSRDDFDLKPHAIGIVPSGSMQAVQIAHFNYVFVEKGNLADAEPGQQHRNRTTRAATAHDSYFQPGQQKIQ
jgi:hypothetical protein